jgi:hypothetical protein
MSFELTDTSKITEADFNAVLDALLARDCGRDKIPFVRADDEEHRIKLRIAITQKPDGGTFFKLTMTAPAHRTEGNHVPYFEGAESLHPKLKRENDGYAITSAA